MAKNRVTAIDARFEAAVPEGTQSGWPVLVFDAIPAVAQTNEGEGVGSSLVRGALDDVRSKGGHKVLARCPFVSSWIDRHPDYADLLG